MTFGTTTTSIVKRYEMRKRKTVLCMPTNRIAELGYTCKWIEQSKCLQFEFKGSTVRFFPYTGWFSGKAVKDGRGLNNLLKQIRDNTR